MALANINIKMYFYTALTIRHGIYLCVCACAPKKFFPRNVLFSYFDDCVPSEQKKNKEKKVGKIIRKGEKERDYR